MNQLLNKLHKIAYLTNLTIAYVLKYSRIYFDENKKQIFGVNVGDVQSTPTGLIHIFDPKQILIPAGKDGNYIININNNSYTFKP